VKYSFFAQNALISKFYNKELENECNYAYTKCAMNTLLSDFEIYVSLNTKVLPETLRVYLKDVAEFFVTTCNNNYDVTALTGAVFIDYFAILKAQNIGTATAARKVSSLKMLCKYLHKQYSIPNYSCFIAIDKNFPILCPTGSKEAIFARYEDCTEEYYRTLSYKELRNYLLLYLLSATELSINYVIELKRSNFCFKSLLLHKAHEKKGNVTIDLAPTFFVALGVYFDKIPFKTNYVFPVESGGVIKPLSRQAAWVLINNLTKNPKKDFVFPLSNTQVIPENIKMLYKIHPRA
jgi:site-specific recombinase XerD